MERTSFPSIAVLLFGSFFNYIEKADPALFSEVSQIAEAALVSEVILSLRRPPERHRTASTLTIFIDGPILMDLIGLGGRARTANLEYIFDGLQRMKCRVTTFVHCIEEIRVIIESVLETPPAMRSGPLGDALRNGDVLEQFAVAAKTNVRDIIERYGISVYPEIRWTRDLAYDELEFALRAAGWANEQSRRRDRRSIERVMYMTSGRHPNDPLQSTYLFVTQNDRLVRECKKFCIDNDC